MMQGSTSRTVTARRHAGPDAKGDVAYCVEFTPSELWKRHSVDIRDDDRVLKVHLSPRIVQGARVRLPGAGYERNGKTGDAYLLVSVVQTDLPIGQALWLWRARRLLKRSIKMEVITHLSFLEIPDAGFLSLELRGHFGGNGYYFCAWSNDGHKTAPLPPELKSIFSRYIDDPELLGRLVKPLCVCERQGAWTLSPDPVRRQHDQDRNEKTAVGLAKEGVSSQPQAVAVGAMEAVEREFKQVFFNLTNDGRERVIQGTMIKRRCTRVNAMRIAIEEWRSDNR